MSLKEQFQALWTAQATPHAASFRVHAWAAARAGGSVLELHDALAWLKESGATAGAVPVRLAVITNFGLQGLQAPLELYLRLLGLEPETTILPPYQLPAVPLDAPTVLVLADHEKFLAAGETVAASAWAAWLAEIRRLAPSARLLVTEPLPLPRPPAVPADPAVGAQAAYRQAVEDACGDQRATLMRWSGPLQELGWARAHRPAHYVHYDQLLTHDGLVAAAQVLARYATVALTPRLKVIAVDADNTLWDGVAGEIGPENVVFLPETPRGRCYHRVLRQLKEFSELGVLLALVSRNDPLTVRAVLERPEFPLKSADFSAMRVNWEPKSRNLRAIAEELNLGLDAFLFVDDSGPELLEVAHALPEVTTAAVPGDIEQYPDLLPGLPGLDRIRVTLEDRRRKDEYRSQAGRRQLQEEAPENFLQHLAIQLAVRPATTGDLPRFAQLLAKTNQFRFAPEKPTEDELGSRLGDPRWHLLGVYYRDLFGDSGLVGAALIEVTPGGGRLHNLVLSCRILGRKVEETLLAEWTRRFPQLEVRFAATSRNHAAADFLRRAGWIEGQPFPLLTPVPAIRLDHA